MAERREFSRETEPSRREKSDMEFSRMELMPESRERESRREMEDSRASSRKRVVMPSSVMLPVLERTDYVNRCSN